MNPLQPLLYIVVRRTTDWSDEAGVRAQLPDRFVPAVDLWNETFSVPYHQFRQKLKDIARENHAQVEGAVTATLDEVPEGALLAPVDDDDWFAPDMAGIVARAAAADRRAFRWSSRFLEVPPDFDQWLGVWRRRIFPSTPLTWVCTTNNYVLEKAPGIERFVDSHIRASEWFVEHSTAVTVLNEALSLHNRNLASQTALMFRGGRIITRSQLLRRHRQYRSLYARSAKRLPAWSVPWIGRMAELMESLGER